MSVHQTAGPECVEVRRTVLNGTMLRVWDTTPGGPLGETEHAILADLRFDRAQVNALITALLRARDEEDVNVRLARGAERVERGEMI